MTGYLRKTMAGIAVIASAVAMLLAVMFMSACGGGVEMSFSVEGVEIPVITAKAGDSITPPDDPTRDGYVFDGWYLQADFSDEKQALPTVMPDKDVTYYGRWQELPDITISFVENGGTEVGDIVAKAGASISAPNAPSRTGYIFDGWYLEEDCSGERQTLPDKMPGQSVTYYAKWNIAYTAQYYVKDFLTDEYSLDLSRTEQIASVEGEVVRSTMFTVENYTVNSSLTLSITVTEGQTNVIDVYLDPTYTRYVDALDGSDVLYYVNVDETLYLNRPYLGKRKCVSYNNDSGIFSFATNGSDTLSGKIVSDENGNYFYYFNDSLEKKFSDYRGGADKMELKAEGAAVYTHDDKTINGSYIVDGRSGTYVFTSDDGETVVRFALVENGDNLCFRTAGWEAGYYAYYDYASATVTYAVVYLDGMGSGMDYLGIDLYYMHIDFTYTMEETEDAVTVYVSYVDYDFSYVIEITQLDDLSQLGEDVVIDVAPEFEEEDLSGIYEEIQPEEGVDGIYEGVGMQEGNTLELSGGIGTITYADGTKTFGEYLIDDNYIDKWMTYTTGYNYGEYVAGYFLYFEEITTDPNEQGGFRYLYIAPEYHQYTMYDGNDPMMYGKLVFENALLIDGEYYNDIDGETEAFIYVYPDGIAEIWVGMYDEYLVYYFDGEYEYLDLLIAAGQLTEEETIKQGTVEGTDGTQYETFTKKYSLYDDPADNGTGETYYLIIEQTYSAGIGYEWIVTFVNDDIVIFDNAEEGKLVITDEGAKYYAPNSETPLTIDFTVDPGLVNLYVFEEAGTFKGGEYAVFYTGEHNDQVVVAKRSNELFDTYKVDFTDSNNITTKMSATKLEIFTTSTGDMYGVVSLLMTNGTFSDQFFGKITVVDPEATVKEYNFKYSDSLYSPEMIGTTVYSLYGEFKFKIQTSSAGEEQFAQYSFSFQGTNPDAVGSLLTLDGYGNAVYKKDRNTTQQSGTYMVSENLIQFLPDNAASASDYEVFIITGTNTFSVVEYLNEEYGFYQYMDEENSVFYELYLDGSSNHYAALRVYGSSDSKSLTGTYTARAAGGDYDYYVSLTLKEDGSTEEIKYDVYCYEEYNDTYQDYDYLFSFRNEAQYLNNVIVQIEGMDGVSEGIISCQGYGQNGVFMLSYNDGSVQSYYGDVHIGNLEDKFYLTDQTHKARYFEEDPDGMAVYMEVYDTSGTFLREFVFDVVRDANGAIQYINLRTMEDGAYGAYSVETGEFIGEYIYLDGHGKATVYSADDQVIAEGEYADTEISEYAFKFISKTEGYDDFVFMTMYRGLTQETMEFIFARYNDKANGVFVNDDLSLLNVNGFTSVSYTDKYGVITSGMFYTEADGTIVLVSSDSETVMRFKINGDKFEIVD